MYQYVNSGQDIGCVLSSEYEQEKKGTTKYYLRFYLIYDTWVGNLNYYYISNINIIVTNNY